MCELLTPPDTLPRGRRTHLVIPHPRTVTVRSFTRSKVAIESWCDQAREIGTSPSFSRMQPRTIVSAVAELVGVAARIHLRGHYIRRATIGARVSSISGVTFHRP